ncbi:MAG: M23 family metallopeptidase [Magnetococcales bacterium]|nr:M23 family metallopeptidase [Magnetococcales bacterium]
MGITSCVQNSTTTPKVRIASGPPLAWGADTQTEEYIDKSKNNIYIVRAGDTLWAIAAVHGIELENLAKWNNVVNSGQLRIGQKLHLVAPEEPKEEKPPVVIKRTKVSEEPLEEGKKLQLAKTLKKTDVPVTPQVDVAQPKPKAITMAKIEKPQRTIDKPRKAAVVEKPKKSKKRRGSKVSKYKTWKLPAKKPSKWLWPHKGRIINRFGRRGQQRNNGIDIAVRVGDPVRAAADGIVAYADSGLPGYGKMILLRHGGSYMTAYGYINQILVRRGQPIKAGERIALAGQSGHATTPRLHFEIRHKVKPLNPLKRLPKKK